MPGEEAWYIRVDMARPVNVPHDRVPTWFYIDSDSKEQGPFSYACMSNWHSQGYLPQKLLMRRHYEKFYIALAQRTDFPLARAPEPQPGIDAVDISS